MSKGMADLNRALFDQLDRLSSGDLDAESLEREVQRTEAIVSLSDQITGNANLQLKAAKLFADHGQAVLPHLPQIGSAKAEDDAS
ncbi:hypothetical protein PVW47_01565 [Marinovum sp. SP66]|uniref:hypothetical protein n=1 Tax=Marinovum TaxID=367771 RepID=UPI00237A4BB0|nr:hypothetical protein [Marinovum sp. SP66]MDD9738461.1 hypothetical protein [Marinovum sp. SP66]